MRTKLALATGVAGKTALVCNMTGFVKQR